MNRHYGQIALALVVGVAVCSAAPPGSGSESETLVRLAQQGELGAQVELAGQYESGSQGAADVKRAAAWYRTAAEKGNAAAQYRLGCLYDRGTGVPLDKSEAVRWYAKAAQQGHNEACELLATKYSNKMISRKDQNVFLQAIRRASELGLPAAQRLLGVIYARGDFVQRDAARALGWYVVAANNGDRMARWILAESADEKTVRTALSDD